MKSMSAKCRQNAMDKGKRREISYEMWEDGYGGAEGQTRTVDTGIFSAVLYHLSYLGEEYLS